jgi:hypothetical protein
MLILAHQIENGYVCSMSTSEQRQNLGKVVARALTDVEFKRRLVAHPETVLQEMSANPPDGVEIVVVENTATKIYLTLPSLPLPTAPTFEEMEALETRKGFFNGNTPKDKGCCGGGSSVGATWLESDDDEAAYSAPVLGEAISSR